MAIRGGGEGGGARQEGNDPGEGNTDPTGIGVNIIAGIVVQNNAIDAFRDSAPGNPATYLPPSREQQDIYDDAGDENDRDGDVVTPAPQPDRPLLDDDMDLSFSQLTFCSAEAIRAPPYTRVTLMNLSNNALEAIPDEIGLLVALQELYLQYNKLTTLPDTVGLCRDLKELDIKNNALVEVGQWISGKVYRGTVQREEREKERESERGWGEVRERELGGEYVGWGRVVLSNLTGTSTSHQISSRGVFFVFVFFFPAFSKRFMLTCHRS